MKKILQIICAILFFTNARAQTYSWQKMQSLGSSAANRSYAVSFSIGSKGYTGTGLETIVNGNEAKSDFWEYDPAFDSWTQKSDFPDFTGRICCVGFSIGNKGYMGTGADGNFLPTTDFYEYDHSTNVRTQKATLTGPARCVASGIPMGGKG